MSKFNRTYKEWNSVIFPESDQKFDTQFTPTLLQLWFLRDLMKKGGKARLKYWKAGDQMVEVFYKNGLLMTGYENGELYYFLSPFGAFILVENADTTLTDTPVPISEE